MQSSIISLKEKFHQTIDCMEDEKLLKALNTILSSYRNKAEDYELTGNQLN